MHFYYVGPFRERVKIAINPNLPASSGRSKHNTWAISELKKVDYEQENRL